MRIKQKLLLGFLFISFLTFGISFGVSFLVQQKAGAIFQEVGGRILPGNIALSRIQTEFYHTLILLDKYESSPDDNILREIEKNLSSLGTHETTYDLFHRDEIFMSRIEQLVEKFSRLVARYLILLQKEDGKKDAQIARQKIDSLLQQFGYSINPHIEEELAISYQKVAEVQKMNLRSQWLLMLGGAFILSLTLLLSLYIAHLFSRPLRILRDAAQQIGSGQLDITLPVTSRDEIGDLAQAFNDMSDNLSAMRLEEERLGLALRRSQKMDAIGQLTGGIAHDFNNLMAIILGNVELLQQLNSSDDKLQKRLVAINKAAERAADLTRQLLGFSRTSAAEQTVTDINQVIAAMDNLIARSLTPEIRLEQRFADDLWLTKIDPGDFEDALLNLSLNARDAMKGHGHLVIETRNATLDDVIYCLQNPDLVSGDYVEIAISDDGEGMSLEQQEHIFEPFFTTKDEGTGLGLAMVFGFIKRSGGCINVYSEPGIGTTFKLYLPRAEDEIQQSMEKASEEIASLFHGHETVLVVDDEEGLLELARQMLEDQGYRVLTAANGKEALDQLANEPVVDLLFSDVVMPGSINGFELAEQATRQHAQLKVLLTSGYTEKAVAHNGQSRFDANLLSKPYNQSELLKRVRIILDGQ